MTIQFCRITDLADFLQIDVDEPAAARAITEATAAIQNYCHQLLWRVTNDAYTFDVETAQAKLFLPELPVISVLSVVEDGTALTVTTDYKLGRNGILHRVDDYWLEGIGTVVVTYTHGYEEDDIPEDIVAVCTSAASRRYQAGLLSADSLGVPGVASKSLGDYSVSFHPVGGSEGTMGASGARLLLLSEKEMLDRYHL